MICSWVSGETRENLRTRDSLAVPVERGWGRSELRTPLEARGLNFWLNQNWVSGGSTEEMISGEPLKFQIGIFKIVILCDNRFDEFGYSGFDDF